MQIITRGDVIARALLKVGNVTDYNDTRSEMYLACDKVLDTLLQEVCSDSSFLFCNTTVKLTQYIKDSETGEYRYNLPSDFLARGVVAQNMQPVSANASSVYEEMGYRKPVLSRISGEYVYSNSYPLLFNYNRKVNLMEVPIYMFDYLVLRLAKELSLIYSSFTDRLPYFEEMLVREKHKIQIAEGNVPRINSALDVAPYIKDGVV